ncbi:CHASE4 domain-containing protein [Sporolituus thermophilus]|uniref:Diguanylate cyclase (GGDEF) domain-containing protein n=1 Tax=Sporolituus thermophilus DSM 23256 TaxID=1123285 RepID=A0A1G7LVI9_9FIRM|nr:CHASE4 domain-containing protein [Sporolituus thermophilus]SDF53505.1 diguanylate cyclase (GGDEF) domain-containing protein [Sporolituus thermophilus DSM 23256]
MTIRKKLLALFLAILMGAAAVMYAVTHMVLLRGLAELEKLEVMEDLTRAANVIAYDIAVLDDQVFDWAVWDDTYQFVVDGNREYIASNLEETIFISPKINFIIFFDNEGKLIFGKGYDLERRRELPLPPSLLTLGQEKRPVKGIVMLPEGPLLVVVEPILDSSGNGPARGMLLFGRYLDDDRIKRLADTVQLSFTVKPVDEQGLPEDFRQARTALKQGNSPFVTLLDNNTIAGYLILPDIHGNPAVLLKLVDSRKLYWGVMPAIGYYLLALILVGFVVMAAAFWVVERQVLDRLKALAGGVAEIGAASNLSRRLAIKGKDEFANLATAINGMLASLEQAEAQLRYFSLHDALTGVYNRAFIETWLQGLQESGQRAINVVFCDLDGLKLVNDIFGHNCGDELLKAFADLLRACCPENAAVARVGGDEFVLIINDDRPEIAEELCTAIRAAVTEYNRSNRTAPLPLSISLGTATGLASKEDILSLLGQADNAMYREKFERSRKLRRSLLPLLKKALVARDASANGHARRLKNRIVEFALACGLTDFNQRDLKLFALFHDIGKVGLPPDVLAKRGGFTPDEEETKQRHVEIGFRIALAVPDLLPIADWILKHHEWWNGGGYPLGFKGEEIPLPCRLLAILDAYDNMTSGEPGGQALSHDAAVEEIKKLAGIRFDPRLVDIFVNWMDGGKSAEASGDGRA